MKQINNTSVVFLSTYDNSNTLFPLSEEYKSLENVCVAVEFGDILIKISPKTTCECNWHDAMNEHREKLMHPAYWQMVGSVYHEVNQAIKMLSHEPIEDVWTDTEDNDVYYSSDTAWLYDGTNGNMGSSLKYDSTSVRAAKVFKL